MCNLYSITRAREAELRLFRVSDNRGAAITPLPAIFPGHTAPVVRQTVDGERELVNLSWGFVLLQEGKAQRRGTNFHDDRARAHSRSIVRRRVRLGQNNHNHLVSINFR